MSFWDSEELIGEVGKNKSEKYVVKKLFKNDKEYRDVRIYYNEDGEFKPSKKGIVIPNDKLDKIIGLLET